jgi:hypothetical protein
MTIGRDRKTGSCPFVEGYGRSGSHPHSPKLAQGLRMLFSGLKGRRSMGRFRIAEPRAG